MSVDLFLNLLISSMVTTIALTEALKRLLNATDTSYRANAVVLDAPMLSCAGFGVMYRIPFGLGFNITQVFRLLALIFCTWILSMVFYDKIVQFVQQSKKVKSLKNTNKKGDTSIVENFSNTVNKH